MRQVQRHWRFTHSPQPAWVTRRCITAWLLRSRPLPASQVIKAVRPAPRWIAYFVYLPQGQLLPQHHFTLQRLREQGLPLLIVAATPQPGDVPQTLHGAADALAWKDLPGYDFSAYRLALDLLAQQSPGADVLLFNDSVLGPFTRLAPFIDDAPWSVTGFTATAEYGNHLQSYALVLRDLRPTFMKALAPLFRFNRCLQAFEDVVLAQELQLARVLARKVSVGSHWFTPENATLARPFELLDQGYPFIKRALLDKHRDKQDERKVAECLARLGHPIEPSAGSLLARRDRCRQAPIQDEGRMPCSISTT